MSGDAVGISGLLTSDRGRRAQMVRAFCDPPKRGRPTDDKTINFDRFAEMGFSGLRSKNSVRKAYEDWELTGITEEPKPGDQAARSTRERRCNCRDVPTFQGTRRE